MPHTTIRRLKTAASLLLLATVAACGGGGGSTETPTPTPAVSAAPPAAAVAAQAVSGTITGFGSVIIDGVKFDDAKVSVAISTDPRAPAAGTLSDLKLGMRVDGVIKDGQLTDVVVRATLVGPVASIDLAGGSFMLYGQTVKVAVGGATPTVFDGAAGLASLVLGDLVEVHGTVDASKALSATRVERKPRKDSASGVRIGGLVSALDSAAKTFKLNDMTIDFSAATLLPQGTALANGQLISAFGDTVPGAGGFKPKAIELVKAGEGSAFALGGRIMAYASVADFSVSGLKIDASAAVFESGSAADLAAGVIVAAEGKVSNGVLKASKLRVLKVATDVLASLKGDITEFVSAGSFKLRGTVVDASGSAVAFSGGSVADLGNGAVVLVKGKIAGELLKADSVEFQALPVAKPLVLKGELRDFNPVAGSFKFLGYALKLSQGVEIQAGSLASLANGLRVEITGTPGSDGVVLVSRLTVLGDLAPAASVLGGRLSDLVSGNFKLAGISVNYGSGTRFEDGAAADLANGTQVLVKGTVNGLTKTLTASWIELIQPDNAGVRLAGAMGDYVSAADFKIGSQRVDASSASFGDGTAADLANGRVLEVRGSLVEVAGVKVVKASQVRFLNK